MAVNVGDLEASLTLDANAFDNAIKGVENKIDGLGAKMKGLSAGNGILTNAAGNLIAGAVRGVVNFGKEVIGQAVDVSAYNEKVKLSLESTIAGEIRAESAIKKRVLASSKTISVESQINSALGVGTKAYNQNMKAIEKANDAQAKLNYQQAIYNDRVVAAAEYTQGKKQSDARFATMQDKKAAQIAYQSYQMGKLNDVVAKGNAIQANMNAVQAKYVAAGPRVVNTYKTVITGYAKTEEQAAIEAQAQVQTLVQKLEQMAIKSPFNKENLVNAFVSLKNFGGMSVDTATKYTQGITDIAAVLKPDGPVLENFAKSIAKLNAYKRAYQGDINQITSVLGAGFQRKLEEAMGTDAAGLRKAIRKGLVTSDVVNPILEQFFKEFEGKAAEFSETLPGLVEALGDVKKNVLGDFFSPILDGAIPAMAFVVDTFTDPAVRAKLKQFGTTIGNALKTGIMTVGRTISQVLVNLGIVGKDNDIVKRFFKPDAVPTEFLDRITKVSDAITGFVKFLKDNSEVIKGVITGVATAIGSLATIGAIGSVIGQISTALTVLASPLGVISVAIVAAVTAWNTNFLGFRDTVNNVINDVKPGIDKLFGAINSIALSLSYGVNFKDAFKTAMYGIVDEGVLKQFDPILGLPDKIKLAWEGKISLKTLLGDIGKAVVDTGTEVTTGIGNWFKNVAGPGGADLITIGLDWANTMLSGFNNVGVGQISSYLSTMIPKIATAAADLVSGVLLAIADWVDALNGVGGQTSADGMAPGMGTLVGNLDTAVKNATPLIINSASNFADIFLKGIDKALERLARAILGNPIVNTLMDIQKVFATLPNDIQFAVGAIDAKTWGKRNEDLTKKFGEWQGDWLKHNNISEWKVPISMVPEFRPGFNDVTGTVNDMLKTPGGLPKGWADANGLVYQGGKWYTNGGDPQNITTPINWEVIVSRLQPENYAPPNSRLYTKNMNGPAAPVVDALAGWGMKDLGAFTQTGPNTFATPTTTIQTPVAVTTVPATTAPAVQGPQTPNQFAMDQWAQTKGLVKDATGNYTAPTTTVNAPIAVNPVPATTVTAPSTSGAAPSSVPMTANAMESWATTQGFVKDGDGYKTANTVNVNIPINFNIIDQATAPAAGNAKGATAGSTKFIDKWIATQGWVLDGTNYKLATPVNVSIPITFTPVIANGAAPTDKTGNSNSFGIGESIANSIADSINSDKANLRVNNAVNSLVRGAITLAKKDLGLEPMTPDNNAGQIGKLMAESLATALGDGLTIVTDKIDHLGERFEDVRVKQIEPTAASISSLANQTMISFAGPKFDTFRLTFVDPLNQSLARMDSLLGSIITKLSGIGTAAQNASNIPVPNVGGASGPAQPPGPGGGNTISNVNNNQKGNGNNQTISLTAVSQLDGKEVGRSAFTFTHDQIVEEMERYG